MSNTEKKLDEIVIKAGETLHLNGMPFQLKEDTVVLGFAENFNLAKNERKGSCSEQQIEQEIQSKNLLV